MLGVTKYSQKHVDACRSRVNLQLSAYKKLVTTARDQSAKNEASLTSAIEFFEPVFFNNMVLLLDAFFVHRIRAIEGKDGNPLNEVRILCNSIMDNNNKLVVDKTIKYDPDRSVLKYKAGDEIKLYEPDFLKIFKAFFSEIEKKYL